MNRLLQLQRFRPACNAIGWQTDQRVQHLKGFSLMTKRTTRNLPAIILMTTALAWNLPVMAQSSARAGTQNQPAENSAGSSGRTALPDGSRTKSDSSQPTQKSLGAQATVTMKPEIPPAGTSQASPKSPLSGEGQGQGQNTTSKDHRR